MSAEIFADPQSWQSLIAGFLGIVAAIIGGVFILFQANSQSRQHKRSRRASFDAARATFPLLLSDLMEWANQTIDAIRALYTKAQDDIIEKADRPRNWPEFDTSLISELRYIIEHCDDKRLRLRLSKILQKLQITKARLSSWRPTEPGNLIVAKSTLSGRIIDLLELRVLIEEIFPFARLEKTGIPKKNDWDRIESGAMLLHLDDVEHPDFGNLMQKRIADLKSVDECWSKKAWKALKSKCPPSK